MAKKKRTVKEEIKDFQLPQMFLDAQEAAKAKLKPNLLPVDAENLKNLVAYLTPFAMPDPHHKGPDKPKTILREAMALLAFDRRAGSFKVSLVDKVLGTGGSVTVTSVSTAWSEVETMLANGTFPWSAKEDY